MSPIAFPILCSPSVLHFSTYGDHEGPTIFRIHLSACTTNLKFGPGFVNDDEFRSAGWTIKARPGRCLSATSPKSTSKLNPLKSSWEFSKSPARSSSVEADWKLQPIKNPVFSPDVGQSDDTETPTLGLPTKRGHQQEEQDGPRASFFDTQKSIKGDELLRSPN